MSWVDSYKAIRDKLEEKITALTIDATLAFEKVYVGRKHTPREFPCCMIYPERIRSPPASTATSYFRMVFDIRAVAKMSGITEGADDVVTRLGAIETMLVADRTLEGTTDNLEVDPIIPEVDRPRVRDRHEASLIVNCYKLI